MNKKPRQMHLDERILRVSMQIYEQRIEICKNCYAYDDRDEGICKIVSTPVSSKCALKAGSCPQGFWSSHYDY